MSKRARLLVPLLVGVALILFYSFLDNNRLWLRPLPLDGERLMQAVAFVTCIPLVLFFVRLIDFFAFDLLVSKRSRVRAPVLLREIVSIALFALLVGSAISAIFNKSVTGFLATGTVLAAILGLALQETLGNLFAGIAMSLEDSFEPGDVIRSGEFMGIVEAVRWRGTRIRTFNNSVVILPNSLLARERLEVFPRNNSNGRVLQIDIDYNVPPSLVINVLVQAASHVDGVVREMPCIARVGAFANSAMTYEIKYFMSDYSMRDRIDADVRRAVWYALRRNNIPIAFPIRSYQKYEMPEHIHPPERAEIVERLKHVDVLSPLTDEEIAAIAASARVHAFSRGETIIRQADQGHSMFIVHEGSVRVYMDEQEIARLEPGDFFGEMALLTGERRSAEVVALSDVVAVEITKEALQPVLYDHPELAATISAKVLERRGTLESRRVDVHEDAHESIVSRIRAYFGL